MSQQRAKGKMTRLSAETQSIKQAVARAVASQSRQITAQEKRKKKRKQGKSAKNPMGDPLGLFADTLRHFHNLPSSKSQPAGYDPVVRTYRVQPVACAAGTALANGTSFILNPWYTFTNYISWLELLPTGVRAENHIPVCMMASLASSNVFPDAATEIAFSLDNMRPGLSTTYSGHVRVLGVEIDIEYTGKLLDCGGTLTILHGGGIGSGGVNSTNSSVAWESSYNTLANLQKDRNKSTVVRFGNKARWVWRPHHLDFVPVRTYRNNQLASAAAGATITEEATMQTQDILANPFNPLASVEAPYGCGFVVNLAQTVAAGTPLPLIVKLRVITHENISIDEVAGVQTSLPVTNNSVTNVSDTAALDKIRNALTATHVARKSADPRSNENPFSLVGAAAVKAGEGILNGALRGLGDRIFS